MSDVKTEFRYDALNRLVEIIPADGPIQVVCYDAAGNPVFRGPAPAEYGSLPDLFRAVHREYLYLQEGQKKGRLSEEVFLEKANLAALAR